MAFFDLPLESLKTYKPAVREPEDFESFWKQTLTENPASTELLTMERTDRHLESLDVFDVEFVGFGQQAVKGWYLRPRDRSENLPLVVSYIGYGGGRGFPEEHVSWATSGFAELVVDSRGQGGSWSGGGDTPDTATIVSSAPGCMTRGIEDPKQYYYRRLFTDAANALVAARGLEGIDQNRIVTSGGSQGGALALSAAGLDALRSSRDTPKLLGTIANVPFMCNFERAVGLTDGYPFQEIVDYLGTRRDMVETAFNTLSYFDVVNFAKRAQGQALFSVGLMDTIVPPSTAFAAYNWYPGKAEIEVYPYNGHEGGGVYQTRRETKWLRDVAGL